MYGTLAGRDFAILDPNESDLIGLNYLKNCTEPVGINDYINLVLDFPVECDHTYWQGTYPPDGHFYRTFVDVDEPTTVTSWDNYKLKLFHECGSVIVDLGSNSSSLYISSGDIPAGYNWLRDNNGNIITELRTGCLDSDGYDHEASIDIAISGISQNPGITTNGTLINDEIWCGNITVTGTVIVPQGVSLTISPYTTISFTNGSSLIIDGSLFVDGEQPIPIEMDFDNKLSYVGIYLNSGAVATLSNFKITNAYYGIYADNAVYTITDGQFIDNNVGLWDENSALYDVEISYSTFQDNSFGVYTNYSYPLISECNFSSNAIGLFCWSASPYLGYAGSYGNNTFSNNTRHIGAAQNANPFLGRNTCTLQGGNNSLNTSTDYYIYATGNCTIMAENNWWGASSPVTSKFYMSSSTIDYVPYLTSQPSGDLSVKANPEIEAFNSSLTKDKSINVNNKGQELAQSNFDNSWPLLWKILYARNLVLIKQFKSARQLLRPIIESNKDSTLVYYAIDLYHQASKNAKLEFNNFLHSLVTVKKTTSFLNSVKIMLAFQKGENTLGRLKEVMDDPLSNNDSKKQAQASMLLFYVKNRDAKSVMTVYNDFIKRYPGDELIPILSSLVGINNEKYQSIATTMENNKLNYNYKLYSNYPNPFNPATIIKYSIAEPGLVQIKVFNILGEQVALLANDFQSEGIHEVTFNASKLSSGVYIYKLQSGSFSESRKMLLMK